MCALLGLVALSAGSAGCAPGGNAGPTWGKAVSDEPTTTITVFAASSLAGAFEALAEAYRKQHPGREVRFNFAGSQRLRTQLEHGATAHVFASADWDQMDAVQEAGLLAAEPVNFASNRLVVLATLAGERASAGANGAVEAPSEELAASHLAELAQPGRRIILGQPEAPIGRYTNALLARMSADPSYGPELVDGLLDNVVSREASVRSIAQKVALGDADAGITYATDARPVFVAQNVRVLELPDSLNVMAVYPIAPAADDLAASHFIEFVLSDAGGEILGAHGFGPAPEQNVP